MPDKSRHSSDKVFREVALNDAAPEIANDDEEKVDGRKQSKTESESSNRPKSLKLKLPDMTAPHGVERKRGKKSYTLKQSGDESSKNSSEGYLRHIVALLALSSIVLANMNRQAYNQSLSSMIRPLEVASTTKAKNSTVQSEASVPSQQEDTTELKIPEYYTEEPTTLPPSQTNESPAVEDDRFDWDLKRVSLLQSAFSYGYTPFMIPGGRLCEIYGAKWIVFLSGFGSALCSAMTPFLADNSFYLLVASRILMGICQTGVSPALYALLTRWLPAHESNLYLPMMKVGVMIGFMFGSSISGFFHWRTTFHLVALISFIWSALWVTLISSDPSEHRFINPREVQYIQSEIQRENKGRKMSVGSARRQAAPWFNILTNPVVLCFMFAKFTVKLSTDAQTIQLPKYLNDVFQVSQELNGVLNSLNFAIQAIFTGFIAWSAKECIQRKLFGASKTQVRRLFQGICNFGMASAYILISFNMSSLAIVCFGIVLLSIASMFGAGGESMTPVDLSTEYSASIMAIANSMANFSGMVLPPLVSFILDGQTTSSARWNMVWWTVGAIIASGGLAFACRVEAELQEFRPEKERKSSSTIDADEKDSINGIEMKRVET